MIFTNPVLMPAILGYIAAQLIKVIWESIKNRRFSLVRMVGAGGMPSSHAAMVCAAATSLGVLYGFESPLFAISVVFALIVMYDATGVRREAGKQAKAFNDLLEKLFSDGKMDAERLKELIGHEPVEVLMGAILGISIGVGWCLWIL